MIPGRIGLSAGLSLSLLALGWSLDSIGAISPASAAEFRSDWEGTQDQTWIGASYWANRLQDWAINDGRLECIESAQNAPMRTVHLLTDRIEDGTSPFSMGVTIRQADQGPISPDAAVGFLIGVGEVNEAAKARAGNLLNEAGQMDYRAAAQIHRNPGPGGGYFVGLDGTGRLFCRSFGSPLGSEAISEPIDWANDLTSSSRLTIEGRETDSGLRLLLRISKGDDSDVQPVELRLPRLDPTGGVALVSHPGTGPNRARFSFQGWRLDGAAVQSYPERSFGPILVTQYTLHRGTLKLTAQLAPLSLVEFPEAVFEIDQGNGWENVATAQIEPSGYVARFRIEDWDATRDTPFRVRVDFPNDRQDSFGAWNGTIRRDPIEKSTVVLAALSCSEQFGVSANGPNEIPWASRSWFPHADLVENLSKHEVDLYFFAGDQIYEGRPTPPIRSPLEKATLDYLYKWYQWCWSFGDLVRDTPCFCIPDDHDVFQGNIWGMAGAPSAEGDRGGLRGGYGMPPAWVNMVQRTQTSHLPDPYNPAPLLQGIESYYTSLDVGGIGFAILEDRKFKSSPAMVPVEMTRDSHITTPGFEGRKADLAGGTLLGDDQLQFLDAFARDWNGREMKAALSQTIFCNLQISSRGSTAGQLDRDLDSNGWPPSGRRRALEAIRKSSIIHIAGDQHLASVVRHGIDDWEDSIVSFCVPAVANLYPRYWNPDYPPLNLYDGMRPFTGRYRDGFENRITVDAVANPVVEQPELLKELPEPRALYGEAVGYGIIRFRKPDRSVTLECWPRHVDPEDGSPFDGWPITFRQDELADTPAEAFLPEIHVRDVAMPVVQIFDDATGALVSSFRSPGPIVRPRVRQPGEYRLIVSDPETGRQAVLTERSLPPGKPLIRTITLDRVEAP